MVGLLANPQNEVVWHRHRDVHVRGPLNNQQRGQGGILAPFKNSLGTALLQGVIVEEVVLRAGHQVVVLDTLGALVTGVGVQQRRACYRVGHRPAVAVDVW